MATEFILTNIFLLSLGTVLFVAVRTLPRIEEEKTAEKKGVIERWIASEIPEKIDAVLNLFVVKLLRKLKVFLLKIDNALAGHLKKIKPDAAADKPPSIDFKEITSKNKDEDLASGK